VTDAPNSVSAFPDCSVAAADISKEIEINRYRSSCQVACERVWSSNRECSIMGSREPSAFDTS